VSPTAFRVASSEMSTGGTAGGYKRNRVAVTKHSIGSPDVAASTQGWTAGDGPVKLSPASAHGSVQALRALTASVNTGATVKRSPTTPKSAISKIGASLSLLTAMIVLEVCMPARCWIAPEMPSAM